FRPRLAVLRGEAQRGDHFVALTLALLLIRGDPHGAPGRDLLDPVKIRDSAAALELVATVHAAFELALVPEVAITAGRTESGALERQLGRRRDAALVADGQDRALDPVSAPFVVDDRLRPELAQAQEPRPTQEGVAHHL